MLLSPASLTLSHLIVRLNGTTHSCHCSLLVEVKGDGLEIHKVTEAL